MCVLLIIHVEPRVFSQAHAKDVMLQEVDMLATRLREMEEQFVSTVCSLRNGHNLITDHCNYP